MLSLVLLLATMVTPVPQALAQTLEVHALLTKVFNYSHELQLTDVDIEINRQRLQETRAAYFPTLNLRYTNEWFEDLSDGDGSFDSVGGTVISANGSKWKNVLGASLQYTLYDFGARKSLYDNARRDVAIARLIRSQKEISLSLQVLELYSRGLKTQDQLLHQAFVHDLRQDIFALSQRLHQAGSLDRLQIGEAAIAVAEASQRLDELTMVRAEVLHNLTSLSGEEYDPQLIGFTSLTPGANMSEIDVTALPEIQAYNLAIDKKQAEYKIARTSYLPRLSFYSSYSFYGSDSGDWSQALSNLDETNFACGIMLDLNIFNGLADQAKAARLRAELQRLTIERKKKIAENETTYRSLQHHAQLLSQRREQWQDFRKGLDSQAVMTERLAREQVLDRLSSLNLEVDLAAKGLQARLQDRERAVNLLKLQILAKGQYGEGASVLMSSAAVTDMGRGDIYE
ncbi:MAG: TolC family protein [Proteobacteria bacterium]|nr:TolC family protein [Pseudomonadota bacterium]